MNRTTPMRLALAAVALVVAVGPGWADQIETYGAWRISDLQWRKGFASGLADFAASHDLTHDAEGHNNTMIVRKCLDGKSEVDLLSIVDAYAGSRHDADTSPAYEIVIDAFYIFCLSPSR